MGVRAGPVTRRPRAAGDALQHRAAGLQRRRRRRQRGHRLDRRQRHRTGPEHADASTASSPSATTTGSSSSSSKRYADRWQGLASVLYSTSDGISRRSFRQDFNVEGPMFYDDNWMGNLNYTVNNLEGPLPFTPQWEVKLNGSYTVPKIEVDLGRAAAVRDGPAGVEARGLPRAHRERRPARRRHHPRRPAADRLRRSQRARPPARPGDPRPARREAIQVPGGKQSLHLVFDGFNIFNSTRRPT